jgi:heme/copper-type cytochrome/quinol oxidase subunit 2
MTTTRQPSEPHLSLAGSPPAPANQMRLGASAGGDDPRARRTRAALTIAVALLLTAIGFVTGGGVDEIVAGWRNTWTEIGLDVLGAIAVGAGACLKPPGRRFGWATVGLMAVLLALEAASIAWSVAPDSSWLASGQMLAYLAVFAGATLLARPLARHWPALIGGFVLWAAALATWSLIVKVFPATLDAGATYGRLQAPFGYWNALATTAAMGVPCCLWLGARREAGRQLAGLSAPVLALLVTVLVLSYSRSADLAAVIAAAIWLVFVPLRLRATAVLALGALGGAVLSVWGLTHHGLTSNGARIATEDHAGHIFGIVIVVVIVLTTAVGIAVTKSIDRTQVSAGTRRRVGTALVMLLVAIAAVAVIGVAASSRGLTGQISHGWHELTNPQAVVSATSAARVFQFGSSRPTYWHEALQVGDNAYYKGVGELGFSVARLRYPGNPSTVFQAHSYVFETYADLGAAGLLVTAALLLCWLLATGRTLAPRRRRGSLEPAQQAERIGLITLATLVLAFGVQSTLDWTWYFAGVSAPALLAAGWLAGRGPVNELIGVREPGGARLDRPAALACIPLLVGVTLLGCWLTWRPLHSADLLNEAEDTSSYSAAVAAQRADPFATLPYEVLSSFDLAAHAPVRAQAELEHATREQPDNPVSWSALAQFLTQRHLWRQALVAADHAGALDVTGDRAGILNSALIAEVTAHLTPAQPAPSATPAPASPPTASSSASASSTTTAVTPTTPTAAATPSSTTTPGQ